MKKRGLLMTIALMFIASLFLSACQKQHEGYVLLTGGTGGTYYPLGGQIAEIIEEETDLKVDMNSSNASADNVQDIADGEAELAFVQTDVVDRKSTRLNSSHVAISYAVFCLKKK